MARNEIPRSVRASLYIDGKPAENSIKSVEQVTRKLRRELNGLQVGTAEWNAKMKQVQTNTRYITEMRKEVSGTAQSMGFLRSELGKVTGIALGALGVRAITSRFHQVVQQNAALSDSLADVRKTTNMTEEEVRKLNGTLLKLNTRTSRDELLRLSYVAGKLGITARQDVMEFVRAADQIAVALGEDLGGADEAIRSIGKLTDIFKMKETYGIEQSMLKVGSLLNELGMAGTASEKFMVDFTERMAGIAPVANMSIESVMAIATVMDELGQRVESSATAIGQFVVKLGADIPKYAKIAGLSTQEFAETLNRDGTEALMAVLKHVDSTGGGLEALAQNMGLIDVAGARGVAALGVLASNTDKYYEKLKIGIDATREATSVTNEFATKNNTLGANLEKLWKRVGTIWENGSLRSWLANVTGWLGDTRDSVDKLTQAFSEQDAKVKELQAKFNPLIERYQELIKRTDLNKQEQLELHKTINMLAASYPVAISRTDEYGRVIELNTDRIRKNIIEEQKYLSIINSKAIKENRYQKFLLEMEEEKLKKALETQKIESYGGFFPTRRVRVLNNDDLIETAEKLQEVQDKIFVLNTNIERMGGIEPFGESALNNLRGYELEFAALKEQYEAINTEKKKFADLTAEEQRIVEEYQRATGTWLGQPVTDTISPTTNNANKAEEKRGEEIQKQREALKAWILSNEHDLLLGTMEASKREIAVIAKKYEDRRAMAHGDQELIRQINAQEEEEYRQWMQKQADENKKHTEEYRKKREEAELRIAEAGMSAREKELHDVMQHYATLIALAEEFGLDSTKLTERLEQAKAEIRQRHQTEDNAKRLEKEREWKAFAVDSAGEIAGTIAEISRNRSQTEYDERIAALESRRTAELANENLTERQRKAINDKYDRLVKEEKRKAFLADKRAAIAQALIYTAVGVAKAIPNWFQVAAAAVAGAAQVAVISSQQPPSYASGGMTDRDPEGYVSQATIFRRSATGRPFRAGEAGREWIAPAWMVEDPRYSSVINTLESIRAEKRGGLSHGAPAAPVASASGRAHDDRGWQRLESSINTLTAEVRKSQNKKVVFDYRAFEEFQMDIEYARRSQSG